MTSLVPTQALSGFIQGSLSKIQTFQGLLKTILQFSRTKSLGKLLIEVLKFFFKNAEIMEKLVQENENEIVVPLFGAAFYTDLDLFQGRFNFQELFKKDL